MGYYSIIAASFFIALALALALTPAAIRLAPRIGAVDEPRDGRRMHTKAMPRFGGLGIFVGVMASLLCCAAFFLPSIPEAFRDGQASKLAGILAGGALIYAVGVADDLRGLSARLKFVLQIACACVVAASGVRISFFMGLGGETGYLGGILSFIVTVVWIVGITNTINLIDGLDGLAAGVAAIASLSIGYTAFVSEGMFTATIVMVALTGGALGFLPYNFHPAKCFMGDSGALFLGFMLASVSIIGPVKSATVIATIIPVLVLGVPIFDTCFAILRRLASGSPIMEADKGHIHHRLMAAGMGQRRSVLTLYGVSGVMGVTAVLFSRDLFIEAAALFLISVMFIFILLTDAAGSIMKPRGINVALKERRERRKGRR
ncbi:MAG: undecaprenyl/decaprenyl-phosphate alpha-N-acetylglucosaminyl 1-phosphate transferase [Clostridiales Family XIII bacterium]|jgi:UDP-GlcNAc:undecaprenyl-phosphate GlcNAc-1-phosphate transferase|nr:undecaprenyl/decaprenyl-phosphate alpha-N-acetylglucosaminyl 1-phosphate transferase [Clostridiales Family XIII bacterium]